jgi:hypothetical protein
MASERLHLMVDPRLDRTHADVPAPPIGCDYLNW